MQWCIWRETCYCTIGSSHQVGIWALNFFDGLDCCQPAPPKTPPNSPLGWLWTLKMIKPECGRSSKYNKLQLSVRAFGSSKTKMYWFEPIKIMYKMSVCLHCTNMQLKFFSFWFVAWNWSLGRLLLSLSHSFSSRELWRFSLDTVGGCVIGLICPQAVIMVFSQCNDYIEACLDEGGKSRKTQLCFHGLNMSCNPDKDCLFTCINFFFSARQEPGRGFTQVAPPAYPFKMHSFEQRCVSRCYVYRSRTRPSDVAECQLLLSCWVSLFEK